MCLVPFARGNRRIAIFWARTNVCWRTSHFLPKRRNRFSNVDLIDFDTSIDRGGRKRSKIRIASGSPIAAWRYHRRPGTPAGVQPPVSAHAGPDPAALPHLRNRFSKVESTRLISIPRSIEVVKNNPFHNLTRFRNMSCLRAHAFALRIASDLLSSSFLSSLLPLLLHLFFAPLTR